GDGRVRHVEPCHATQARVMFADEPGERILVPAPKRVEERRFVEAHGRLLLARPAQSAVILACTPSPRPPAPSICNVQGPHGTKSVKVVELAITPLAPKEDETMSVKLLVLYPTPTDPNEFDRRYEREHLPMGKASLVGATGLSSHRILGAPGGKSPFARLTEVSFPTLKAVQECAALPAAQKTLAHAVEISTGGAPHFMILEQEG